MGLNEVLGLHTKHIRTDSTNGNVMSKQGRILFIWFVVLGPPHESLAPDHKACVPCEL
jgi:hypothetical protein